MVRIHSGSQNISYGRHTSTNPRRVYQLRRLSKTFIRIIPIRSELNKFLYLCIMKNKLPYEATSKAIQGYSESVIAKSENNDCVVRAFASAFEISYDKAHKYVKEKFGRKDRQGTFGTVLTLNKMVEDNTQVNYKKVKSVGKKIEGTNLKTLEYEVKVKGKKVNRKMTVGTFIKQNPKGTFFVLVRQHAFTIKDGVVIGNYEDAVKTKKIMKTAFQVK